MSFIVEFSDAESDEKNESDLGSSMASASVTEQVKTDKKTDTEQELVKDKVLRVLGMDPDESMYKKIKYHLQINDTWGKWKIAVF